MATNTPFEVIPLRQASRAMVRELGFLQDNMAEARVTHAQCHALIELAARGALGVGELAELLRLDKSTVSRTVAQLQRARLVAFSTDAGDRRKKGVTLTALGRRRVARIDEVANARVHSALSQLSADDRQAVVRGLDLYARALTRSRRIGEFSMRTITRRDDAAVARLIRTVMPEFGANGPGFAILDPEVDAMSTAYRGPRAHYWVITRGGRVVGGGGYAPLQGGDRGVCELRKMYFLPEARGLGLGEALLDRILDHAKRAGFASCYLETLGAMAQARRLYEKKGFSKLNAPRGSTGHFGCNAWYEMPLR
jgi:putative acetyltransferase